MKKMKKMKKKEDDHVNQSVQKPILPERHFQP